MKPEKDIINEVIGKLTVISKIYKRDKNNKSIVYWECKCECGNKKIIRQDHLTGHKIKSCGCIKKNKNYTYPDLPGGKFNKLTVIKKIEKLNTARKNKYWLCICDCGTSKVIREDHLIDGTIKSCGCLYINNNIDELILSSAYQVYRLSYNDGDISFNEFLILSQLPCYYCNSLPKNICNIYKGKNKKTTLFAKK